MREGPGGDSGLPGPQMRGARGTTVSGAIYFPGGQGHPPGSCAVCGPNSNRGCFTAVSMTAHGRVCLCGNLRSVPDERRLGSFGSYS